MVFIYDLLSEPSLKFDDIVPWINAGNFAPILASIS